MAGFINSNFVMEYVSYKFKVLSADSSRAENFKRTFQLFVEKEGYSQDSVNNADESDLSWKALPRTSSAWF